MAKSQKTQLLTLSLIATLLFLTPLLSSSLRSTYLYFIINVLIISLGAEAGLLSPTSSSPSKNPELDTKRPSSHIVITPKPISLTSEASVDGTHVQINTKSSNNPRIDVLDENNGKKKVKTVNKMASENIVYIGAVRIDKVKKCSSTPSIFFIGSDDNKAEELNEEKGVLVEEETNEDEEEELFVKAEVFIGNFYKQLKMQREESWKRIHGVH